ncbi:hypothetical protein SS50377_26768 [Spironucleus salmonicida]|uniref:Uncharacterized protein n=1 Tax=Spironucleus salmonicida TaxID=348837 RepID=V6LX82_9EUKA|nr:hypothetical protein SS50377_26768 [Spironucleus salmonicida]|eukprot:EST49237.1 Hypothetical protein SS50377_10457 [Spironucleus salmonicida]
MTSLTHYDLATLADADQIRTLINPAGTCTKQSTQNVDVTLILQSPVIPLPVKILNLKPAADQQRLAHDTLMNFLNASFEQRVNGNAVQLLKESEDGITSTLGTVGSTLDANPHNIVFPFHRTIAHYAFYYKWLAVVDYFLREDLLRDITSPDSVGMTPLDLYYVNYRELAQHIDLDDVKHPQHPSALKRHGTWWRDQQLYKIACQSGMLQNISNAIAIQVPAPSKPHKEGTPEIMGVKELLTVLFAAIGGTPTQKAYSPLVNLRLWPVNLY